MSNYHIVIELKAAKALTKIHPQYQSRIANAIDALSVEPRPDGCVKLTGTTNAYRVRVGDYRVVYEVADSINIVTVTRIGHRKDIYER